MESQTTPNLDPSASQTHFNVIRIVVILIITTIIIYIGSQKIITKLSWTKNTDISSIPKDLHYQILNSSPSTPKRAFDVVLSYYAEDVAPVARFIIYLRNVLSLQKLKPYIIVYNKNLKINDTYLKDTLKADIVQKLPNVGREGGTYLYHIIENYDTLADHTIFCQAGVEGITNTGLEDWFSNRLEKQFNSSVGYMPLVNLNWMAVYDCGKNPNNNLLRLAELWAVIEDTICPPNGQAIAFRGQFLAGSKRIRIRPLRVYKYINDLLTADSTHWIHKDPRSPISVSTPENPFFGHIVERLWTVLFNCSKPDLPDRCRRNECACFD